LGWLKNLKQVIKKREDKTMNKSKRIIKLHKKDNHSEVMRVEVRQGKILSSKGFVRDVKYNSTTRIDIIEEKYVIPEQYSI